MKGLDETFHCSGNDMKNAKYLSLNVLLLAFLIFV